MSETLPPTYWDDVNRHCGDILARVQPTKIGIFILSTTIQKASWQAIAKDTTAQLEKGVNRSLGGLRKSTYHILRLLTPAPELGKQTEYGITFDPVQEVIVSATNLPEFKIPDPAVEINSLQDARTQLQIILDHAKARNRELAEFEALGLHLPGPEDYDLLLHELRHGAAQT